MTHFYLLRWAKSILFLAVTFVCSQATAQLTLDVINDGTSIIVTGTLPAGTGTPALVSIGTSVVLEVPAGTFTTPPTVGTNAANWNVFLSCYGQPSNDPAIQTITFTAQGTPASPAVFLTPGTAVTLFDFPLPSCVGLISIAPVPGTPGANCTSTVAASSFQGGSAVQIPYSGGGTNITDCDPNGAFPVELLSFKATAQDYESQLDWVTATEIDNVGFGVERSFDGDAWQEIGWVDGRGTTNETQTYQFFDRYPKRGVNYYRLRQYDADGASTLSNVEALTFGRDSEKTLQAYPNPTGGPLVLEVQPGPLDVTVMDATGRVALKLSGVDAVGGKYELDLSELAPAAYQLRVLQGGEVSSLTVVRVDE